MISNNLSDNQDKLRQLSSKERNFICGFLNKILQPAYEYYRQKRYGENYSPQFFYTKSEKQVIEIANTTRSLLQAQLDELAEVSTENENKGIA